MVCTDVIHISCWPDDDCDLDTLSALLEEESDDNSTAVDRDTGDDDRQEVDNDDELDAEALSSMLEADSDLEGRSKDGSHWISFSLSFPLFFFFLLIVLLSISSSSFPFQS